VIDELPDPESLAEHQETMADVPDEFVFDNPGSAMSKAEEMGFAEIHTHGDGEDTVFMPGATHSALMDMISGDDGSDESMTPSNADTNDITMDNITEEEVAALEDYRDLENPAVVEQDTIDALENQVGEVEGLMREALADRTDLKEATLEALAFEALKSEFETDEGDFDVEALTQTPESGNPSDPGTEALSDDADMDKAEALYQDYQTFGTDGLKADIQEALGVSEWDTATEVLTQ